jgi:hypothetical protein
MVKTAATITHEEVEVMLGSEAFQLEMLQYEQGYEDMNDLELSRLGMHIVTRAQLRN